MSQAVRHHYVPEWYQHRFLDAGAGQTKLYYLDMHPDLIDRGPRLPPIPRTALRPLGPANCFYQDHLYTLIADGFAPDVSLTVKTVHSSGNTGCRARLYWDG